MDITPVGIISMEVVSGISIESACALAVSIATKLECYVSFELNSIELKASPYQDFTTLITEYHNKVKELNNWIDYLKQSSTK